MDAQTEAKPYAEAVGDSVVVSYHPDDEEPVEPVKES